MSSFLIYFTLFAYLFDLFRFYFEFFLLIWWSRLMYVVVDILGEKDVHSKSLHNLKG